MNFTSDSQCYGIVRKLSMLDEIISELWSEGVLPSLHSWKAMEMLPTRKSAKSLQHYIQFRVVRSEYDFSKQLDPGNVARQEKVLKDWQL